MTRRPEHNDDEPATQATRFVPKSELPKQAASGSVSSGQAGPYELMDKISDGGQAVIYKARDRRDGRIVAIKLFKTIGNDPEAEHRFKGEMDILMSLEHANIINELGTVEIEDEWGALRRGMAMEFLDGLTFKEWVARNPRGTPWEIARPILLQCLDGLDYAFTARNVVHRDIKPSNIFILGDGTVKLIDFGVAHVSSEESQTSGGLLGSFDYMAPDFARAESAFRGDVVSDIFGLFVCFYELLTGKLPFPKFGERPDFEYMARWKGNPPPVSHAHIIFRVVAHLSKFIDRGLSVDRSKRFQNYAEVREQLNSLKNRVISHGKDQYELLDGLGAGAFGEVFKARRAADQVPVAIKRLFPDRSGDKFIKEARILAKTQYPGVVRYLDFFQSGADPGNSSYFLVMEYLDGMPGSSLRERIKASAAGLPLAEVIPTFMQYASALGNLHYRGIIHRDIKPANLYALADHPEKACILDLGVARDLSGTKTTGSVPGSWDYMAPELLSENTRGSPRSDLYALGMSLYEAITGGPALPRLPRDDREAYPELIARANGTSNHSISYSDSVFEVYPELVQLINRLTARRPHDRPNDARVVFDELLAFGMARLKLNASDWPDKAPPALPEAPPDVVAPAAGAGAGERTRHLPGTEEGARKSKAPALVVALVLLLAAGGGGWWWLTQRGADEDSLAGVTPAITSRNDSTPATPDGVVLPAAETKPPAAAETALTPDAAPVTAPPVTPPPPVTPAVNPEVAELVRQAEILYRLYPVSFGFESFERDIAQRARSLRGHLRNISDPSVLGDEKVITELRRFCAKMNEYALSEALAQNDPQYFAIIRESVYHGVTLEPGGIGDGVAQATALFASWQKAIPRLPRRLEWPLGAPNGFTWSNEISDYLAFLFSTEAGAALRSRLAPSQLTMALSTEAGRGFAARSLALAFAMIPDAPFPPGEPHASALFPIYMAVIETPVEAMRVYRDDATRMTEEQRRFASGNLDAAKTRGAADAPYAQATPEEAMEFCNWLSLRAGLPAAYQRTAQGWSVDLNSPGFRLPTVSEWLFAARCGIDFHAPPGQLNWAQLRDQVATDADPTGGLVYFLYKDNPRSSANSPAYPLGLRDLSGNVAEICMVDPPEAARHAPFTPEFVTKGGNAASKAAAAVMPEFRAGRIDDPTGMIGFRVILPLPFSRFDSIIPAQGDAP